MSSLPIIKPVQRHAKKTDTMVASKSAPTKNRPAARTKHGKRTDTMVQIENAAPPDRPAPRKKRSKATESTMSEPTVVAEPPRKIRKKARKASEAAVPVSPVVLEAPKAPPKAPRKPRAPKVDAMVKEQAKQDAIRARQGSRIAKAQALVDVKSQQKHLDNLPGDDKYHTPNAEKWADMSFAEKMKWAFTQGTHKAADGVVAAVKKDTQDHTVGQKVQDLLDHTVVPNSKPMNVEKPIDATVDAVKSVFTEAPKVVHAASNAIVPTAVQAASAAVRKAVAPLDTSLQFKAPPPPPVSAHRYTPFKRGINGIMF